ncbi:MAG: WYL domain-containing protein [Actinobacteria bacterium]|nr:WYL domain-containing protein [Actinomycetota bacterium]
MTEKSERLVNLVIALKEVRRPVTFAWIKDAIHAYQQEDPESARRQFERDKDDLRSLGIPVETRDTDALGGELGYIIDHRAYELPPISLTAEEITALAVALQMTGEERARLAYAKLAARAPDPGSDGAAPQARVSLGLNAIDQIAPALREHRPVTFAYRTATGEDSQRTVDPYAVVARRGHWYLVGRDHDRDDVRAFRLDRLISDVTPGGEVEAYSIPEGLDVSTHLEGPDREHQDVTIALAPRVAWEAEARGGRTIETRDDDWTVVAITDAPITRTVSWIVGLGDEAEVIEPIEVRERVVSHLRAVAGVES